MDQPPPADTSTSNSRVRPETLRRNPNRPVNPLGRTAPRAAACRRCRRIRVKCINTDKKPPCQPCEKAGEECTFPNKGEVALDREYRSPRRIASTAHREQRAQEEQLRILNGDGPRRRRGWSTTPANPVNGPFFSTIMYWPKGPGVSRHGHLPAYSDSLPPLKEIIESVKILNSSYFQLAFLSKSVLLEELSTETRFNTMSRFLLFGILSLSARFTPCLVSRFQTGDQASHNFLAQAVTLVPDHMFNPTLDSIQGFFLISLAEWTNGDTNRSSVYMSIAMRLAGMLRMHREETYRLPETATGEEIARCEMARRTFWMLVMFESLHYGLDSTISFSYGDITTLLPCDEGDFNFGSKPAQRAALMSTPSAKESPDLVNIPHRSLLASLIQAHYLWSQVVRLVSTTISSDAPPSSSDYRRLSQTLKDFENQLPPKQRWSIWKFHASKVDGIDVAYLSLAMILRLSNIILLRGQLHSILRAPLPQTDGSDSQEQRQNQPDTIERCIDTAKELMENLHLLQNHIYEFFHQYCSSDRGSYPALVVFCIYVCGAVANYVGKQPRICPRAHTVVAPDTVQVSIARLRELRGAWSLAERWYVALCKAASGHLIEETGQQSDASWTAAVSNTVDVENAIDSRNRLSQPGGSIVDLLEKRATAAASVTTSPPCFGFQFNTPLLSESMLGVIDKCIWGNNGPINT